jgi:hypothetical protein
LLAQTPGNKPTKKIDMSEEGAVQVVWGRRTSMIHMAVMTPMKVMPTMKATPSTRPDWAKA